MPSLPLATVIRKQIVFRTQRLAARFGYDVVRVKSSGESYGVPYAPIHPAARYSPWIIDVPFNQAYEQVRPYTMVDRFRCYELWSLVLQAAKLDGAVIEVGVRRGGSGALMGLRMANLGWHAPIYLCDTFRGIVKAGPHDPSFRGGEYADTSRAGVEVLAASLGLANVTVLEGTFPEESGHLVPPGPIALCHVDVDVFESARGVVDWLEDRLVPGGIIVFDDYGFQGTGGVAKFVNGIKDDAKWLFFHNLNGHALLVRQPNARAPFPAA